MMHDQAVHNMADTFSGLILAGLADRAMVVDRAGSTLWQMPTFTDGELVEVSARQGREALAAGQQLSALSMVEAQSWLEEFTRVVPQCLRAGGDDLDVANVVGLLASEARNIASIAWPKDASRQVGAAAEVAALREACFSADWVDGSVVDVRAAAAGHAAASRWFGHDVER
jgi:hypothetical protein